MKRENNFLSRTILDIENFSKPLIKHNSAYKTFELHPHSFLISNLVGGMIGTLFVRSMLYELGINEHHIFRWRLENKYIQYLILNHYNPGCIPKTISFSKLLNRPEGASKIRELFKKGFFIKATLSECSKNNNFDRTADFDDLINSQKKCESNQNEQWILQKKLNLKNEFRVHTFCRDMIYGLTFMMSGLYTTNPCAAEEFVKSILEKLPDTILQGTLIAWDVGLTHHDKYYIIEANFTGFHPEYNYGFQTSGHFQSHPYGPVICAWFNNFIKNKYKISVAPNENELLMGSRFYQMFMCYTRIFTAKHFQVLTDKSKETTIAAVLYLEEDSEHLLITLISYFQQIKYARIYYLITKEKHQERISSLFKENKYVKILPENTLFTADQYQLIKQLNHQRRKQISCYHAIRKVPDRYTVIFCY